jgi:hypothetical protein
VTEFVSERVFWWGMELLQIGIKGGYSTALQIAKNPGLENQIQFLPVGPPNNPQ